jgi:hypothetical protein
MRLLIILTLLLVACGKEEQAITPTEYRTTQTISFNEVDVDVVIDKPAQETMDALVLFHGTVLYDRNIIDAATILLDKVENILERQDMLIVSVAYPGEELLLGDNIAEAEAALLWVKHRASEELGITLQKVFLLGHSQGGYLVTRLNTMHPTDGVIANAPGPLNLVYRCQLEEEGQIPSGSHCTKLRNAYGSTTSNPDAYFQRSLLNFTHGFKSDILFVQGLADTPIQLYSWPTFRQAVMDCSDCLDRQFLEIPDGEHPTLFVHPSAQAALNDFINR